MTESSTRSDTQSEDIVQIIPLMNKRGTTISNIPEQAPKSSHAKRKRSINGTPSVSTNNMPNGQATQIVKKNTTLLSKTVDTDIHSSALNQHLQVFFVSNRPVGDIEPEEAEKLKAHIINEMSKAMAGPEGGPLGPELRFRNSGLTEVGWFLITAGNTESRDWLVQDCKQLTGADTCFRAILATEALCPAKVNFEIKCEAQPDIEEVVKMLNLQNRTLQVTKWKHLKTAPIGEPGNWCFTFRVNGEIRKQLEAEQHTLWYELVKINICIAEEKHLVFATSQKKKSGKKHH